MRIHHTGEFPEDTPPLFKELFQKIIAEDKLMFSIFGYPPVQEILDRTPEEIQRRKEGMQAQMESASHALLREQVEGVLASLTERERLVIEQRFGLEDGRSRTPKEVGQALNRSDRTVRRIEHGALQKLRSPDISRRLRDYLDR